MINTELLVSTLYEGSSIENITLNDDANNYKYIEIFYKNHDGFTNSIKIYKDYYKNGATLQVHQVNSDGYADNISIKNVYVSGNQILNMQQRQIVYAITYNNQLVNGGKENKIYITKVVGYK